MLHRRTIAFAALTLVVSSMMACTNPLGEDLQASDSLIEGDFAEGDVLITTARVNLRDKPSQSNSIALLVIDKDQRVTVRAPGTQDNGEIKEVGGTNGPNDPAMTSGIASVDDNFLDQTTGSEGGEGGDNFLDQTGPGAPSSPSDPAAAAPDPNGCQSRTLGRTIKDLGCVYSNLDKAWEQCHVGRWYRLTSTNTGPYGACSEVAEYGTGGTDGTPTKPADSAGMKNPTGEYWYVQYGTDKFGWVSGQYLRKANDKTTAGDGTAAEIAQRLLKSGQVEFADRHQSGKAGATAIENIRDAANGRAASRSKYGTAPGGSVALNAKMLATLETISKEFKLFVSELAGGSHSSESSRHYAGTAFDVTYIDRDRVNDGPKARRVLELCRYFGAKEAFGPPRSDHPDRLHCAW